MPDRPPTGIEASAQGVALQVIGRVVTAFHDPADTPIQSQRDVAGTGRVELHSEFHSGLAGIEGFDYVLLITHLDRPTPPRHDPDNWTVVPFLLSGVGVEVGTFATRHPTRPNPIGLSLVGVDAVHPDGFDFRGVDLLDGTPVLDVKPWVPNFDIPREGLSAVRTGWYERDVLDQSGVTPSELGLNGTRSD